ALMSSSANNKNLELIISPAFDADELIGDGLRLQQVLVNLISNAIKFTEQGEVELKVSIDSETGDQQHLRFTVRDTGIGISSAQQQEIFSAFTQADNTISRRFGGSGLGLAICQQLLKLMGGELFVNSRLGQGSEFWFVLPLQRNPSAQRSPSQMADLHLLVVDDSSIAREALSLTAQSLGWHVDQAESGETAIAQTLTQVENLHPYDVILLDWKMPGLDGLATAQAIRETLSVQADDATATPIVLMITAYSREELLAQTGINHIDAFLSKPLTPSSLYTAVSGVLHDRLGENLLPPILSSAKPSHAIPGVRVLVVDDSDMNREVALRILESEGAVVSQAKDGQEALEWLSAHADAIDIVLMDVQMPRMDGYTATRQIRRNPLWRDLPIVALTAGAFTNLQDAALESGMNDFVAKPFNVPLMLSVIQRLTGCQPETTAALAVDKQHARLDGADNQVRLPVVNVNSQDFNQPGINVAAGLAIWGEKAAYQAYLARFVEQYRDAGRDIAQAATHGDEGAAAALAHKLKGVAYNLALTNVAARSVDIETALNDGRPVSDAALLLQAAIDEAAVSVSAWLTADPLLDENTENLATLDYNQADVKNLLVEFLAILDQDSPGLVDPLLARLENLLGAEPMTAIKAQIREFNFRAAEQLTKALIFKIENPNIP
ncbi:MAG: response regulator, partial [Methylococcales bacterium]